MFSECGKFRYILSRTWDMNLPVAMCIGLNPSIAGRIGKDGKEKDDPTIGILTRTLRSLGYGGLKMCNLFALISSKPEKLFTVPDNQGSNYQWLETTAYGVQEIIFCWGNFKGIDYRAKRVMEMFPSGKCFAKNQDGSPMHPMAIMWQGLRIEKLIPFK